MLLSKTVGALLFGLRNHHPSESVPESVSLARAKKNRELCKHAISNPGKDQHLVETAGKRKLPEIPCLGLRSIDACGRRHERWLQRIIHQADIIPSSATGKEHRRVSSCYPPAWVKNYKNLPPEVIPGAKLGYSKEESAKRLRPEVRELLDLLRRIYYEPALLAHPKEVLNLLHVKSVKRDEFRTRMSDGSIDQSFKEYFRAGGLFDRGYWRGYYVYQGFDNDIPRERWGARIEVELDRKLECIDSRAVEGYIDLPIDPGLWPPLNPVPRERWDRHGIGTGGGLIARSPASSTAGVTMWFADGCLAAIGAGARFENKKVSNEEVFKR